MITPTLQFKQSMTVLINILSFLNQLQEFEFLIFRDVLIIKSWLCSHKCEKAQKFAILLVKTCILYYNMNKNNNLYSILLPTYNERENLPIVIFILNEIAQKHQLKFQIIIVEDNSPDGTKVIAHDLAKHFTSLNIKVLERRGKLGLGSAYRDGLRLCTGHFVIIMDADLSHHPKYIPVMIEKQLATGADIVTGSRYRKDGGVEGWSFYRKLTSRTANFLTKFVLSIDSSDFTGSFRLYKKERFEELIQSIKTKGYSFQMEILVRAKRLGLTIEEVPIIFVDRLFGQSKLGSNQIYLYLKGICQLFFDY